MLLFSRRIAVFLVLAPPRSAPANSSEISLPASRLSGPGLLTVSQGGSSHACRSGHRGGLLAGCGRSSSRFAENWTEESALAGSEAHVSLTEAGSTISSTDVRHVEAADVDISFSVSGTSDELVSTYEAQIEHFTASLPDPDHVLLSNPDFARHLVRC